MLGLISNMHDLFIWRILTNFPFIQKYAAPAVWLSWDFDELSKWFIPVFLRGILQHWWNTCKPFIALPLLRRTIMFCSCGLKLGQRNKRNIPSVAFAPLDLKCHYLLRNKEIEIIIYIKGNFIFYNTVALDIMRICTSPNILDPLGFIENTWTVQKKKKLRRTEDICWAPPNMFSAVLNLSVLRHVKVWASLVKCD